MASPPNRAHARSPVYPPHIPLPNPKKRPSLSVASHSAPKRRKPSSVTTSTPATSHPLRQTSFPPEESAGDPNARSPSIESDVTGVTGGRSVITAGIGARKARARKRRKGEGSVRSGARASGGDEASGSGQVEDGAEEEEEDGDGDGDEGLVDDGEKVDRAAEKKNLAYVQLFLLSFPSLSLSFYENTIADLSLSLSPLTESLSTPLTTTKMIATTCFAASSSRKKP